MAKKFSGLVKTPAPQLTSFEKEVYESTEYQVENDVHENNDEKEKNDDHELTPFSTRISKGLYKRLRQFEYWERARITDVTEHALAAFLDGKEGADKPLPAHELERQEKVNKRKKRKL